MTTTNFKLNYLKIVFASLRPAINLFSLPLLDADAVVVSLLLLLLAEDTIWHGEEETCLTRLRRATAAACV